MNESRSLSTNVNTLDPPIKSVFTSGDSAPNDVYPTLTEGMECSLDESVSRDVRSSPERSSTTRRFPICIKKTSPLLKLESIAKQYTGIATILDVTDTTVDVFESEMVIRLNGSVAELIAHIKDVLQLNPDGNMVLMTDVDDTLSDNTLSESKNFQHYFVS